MSEPIELLRAYDPFVSDGGDGGSGSGTHELCGYLLLDVFAERPLEGNQLAVVGDGRGIEGSAMQALAGELKLSETVFMLPPQDGGDVRVRIFTPTSELPFAGHPVLGAAVLASRALGRPQVVLETGAGPVAVVVAGRGALASEGRMSQPIPTWEAFGQAEQLLQALGLERSGLPIEIYCNGPRHAFVEVQSEQALTALSPDLSALERLGEMGVSCFAGRGERWTTRVFAPALGVPEDPATGSAAGPLSVHLARHGRSGFGVEIEIRQGAEIGRPSLLRARATGSPDAVETVEVAGRAILVGRGRLRLP